MKTPTWRQIQGGLKEEYKAPDMRDADEFWADFRARASLVNQDDAEAATPSVLYWRRPVLTVAAAACILLLSVFAVLQWHGRSPAPGLQVAQQSEVQEIEVFVPYSSMMIMQDAESGTSVVWLTDTETTESPKGEG